MSLDSITVEKGLPRCPPTHTHTTQVMSRFNDGVCIGRLLLHFLKIVIIITPQGTERLAGPTGRTPANQSTKGLDGKVVTTNKANQEKQYTWVPVQVEDPQNPAVIRTIMTRVTVPERPPPAREAILIPGPAVSRPTSKWLQRVQAILSKGKQQEAKLPFEATGRTPANQGTERLG